MNDRSEKINAAYLVLFGPQKIIFWVGVPLSILFTFQMLGPFDKAFPNFTFPFLRHIRSIGERIILFEFGSLPLWVAQDFVCVVMKIERRGFIIEPPKFFALKVVDIEGWFSTAA